MKNPIAICHLSGLAAMLFITVGTFAQIPSDYYNAAQGLTGAELKTALHNIIKDHAVQSYDYLWTAFNTTDKNAENKVWDMYSNCTFEFSTDQCGDYLYECDCYNREHSFPASWFNNGATMYTDLFHVFPADGKVNSIRGNYPFGQVTNPTITTGNGSKLGFCSYPGYSGTVFEPIDDYKGDFARTYFYMATRYEDLVATWYINSAEADAVLQENAYPVFETWYLEMLGEWHVNDPVSQKENDRNNAVYAIQNNRNPFIDHPEYVYQIWDVGLAPEPANHAGDFSAHTLTLSWNDATGPSLPEGYLVRMSATGFEAIAAPLDGSPVPGDFWNKNVAYGVQKTVFGNLTPNTTYYFKIYGYRGTGSSIDYKTDGAIQQISIEAK